jgi:hypothetical protein
MTDIRCSHKLPCCLTQSSSELFSLNAVHDGGVTYFAVALPSLLMITPPPTTSCCGSLCSCCSTPPSPKRSPVHGSTWARVGAWKRARVANTNWTEETSLDSALPSCDTSYQYKYSNQERPRETREHDDQGRPAWWMVERRVARRPKSRSCEQVVRYLDLIFNRASSDYSHVQFRLPRQHIGGRV